MTLLYAADHPYARPARGTLSSLRQIRREDLAAFHAAYVSPTSLRVAVAGDVEPEAAIDAVARVFSDWRGPATQPDIVPAPPDQRRQLDVIAMPGKAQTDISYGFTAIRRLDPRYYAVLASEQRPGRIWAGRAAGR